MRKEYENNPVVKHSIELSLMMIKFVKQLEDDKKYIIARQILRSGTAVGASIIEAQSAESKADFIHKLKIADKEAHETWYWLYLCEQSDNYAFNPEVRNKLDEVMRLLNAIIKNTKQ
jgi:four helix bundle protein